MGICDIRTVNMFKYERNARAGVRERREALGVQAPARQARGRRRDRDQRPRPLPDPSGVSATACNPLSTHKRRTCPQQRTTSSLCSQLT